MRAFISFSINDKDQYLLTLLSYKLREKLFTIWTSQNFYSVTLDDVTKNQINESHLFIGLITKTGIERDRVLSELTHARKMRIPSLLLVENTIGNFPMDPGVIKFDRRNPQEAINIINEKMNETPASSNAMGWIIGGAVLLAFLSWLQDDE